MLQRLGPSVVRAGDAAQQALFPSGLEFNPPTHGPWNIVHIGMLVPEAHQIYICAVNCMRGVVLTAAEAGLRERFSCVVLKEEDIVKGTVEQITREGIADVLHKLPALPPCVIVFPVCTHHFLGVSMAHVYDELKREFPEVDFVQAYMDPIMRRRISPDERLRKVMYDPLRPCEADEGLAAVLGSDFPQGPDSDLRALLARGGCRLAEIHDCTSYAEYLSLARAGTMLSVYPNARLGAERAAARLGRRHLHLPMSFDYDEIASAHEELCGALGIAETDIAGEVALCEAELERTRATVAGTPVAIDATAHPRPLGLARLLLEHGFDVREVYLDAVADDEAPALAWLKKHAPEVQLSATVAPEMRVAARTRSHETLAIGQRAAWFTGTAHFVNIIEGGGLWGFAGVRAMARLMREAKEEPKDARSLLPRKGLGCVSCL